MTNSKTREARGEKCHVGPPLSLLASCLLLLTAVSPLAAQASLADAADAAVLRGEPPSVTIYPDLPSRLVDGLRYLASFQRSNNRTDIERALFLFNQEGAAGPSAWPHYLSARAFALLDQRDAQSLGSDGKIDGERNVDAMWRQLAEAITEEPSMLPARRLAMQYLVRGGDRELRHDHLTILVSELSRPDAIAEAFLVQGRHQRTLRRDREAMSAFEESARRGVDSSVVALEMARTARALGDTVAALAHYWRGIDGITDAGRELYRLDLSWIVADDSIAGFTRAQTQGNERRWMERFWAHRDAVAGRQPGGRLLEHLRRWNVAHQRYRLPVPWTRDIYTRFWNIAGGAACVGSSSRLVDSLPLHPPTQAGDLRHREPLLDHRGFVYLRHGEPVARATPPNFDAGITSTVTRESWVYWLEGRWRSMHFDGSTTFGFHAPTTMMSYLPLDLTAWLSLAAILPEFQAAAHRLSGDGRITPFSCEPPVVQAIAQQREDMRIQWSTDSDTPNLTAPWNAAIRTFALGTASRGDGRAVVSFALPADQLIADTLLDNRIIWEAHFALKAFRASDGTTIAVDSTRRFIGSAMPPDANLTVLFELPLGQGQWELSMTVDQGPGAAGAYGMARNLAIASGTSLALSDLVPGREGSPMWTTPDGPFPLHPLGIWKVGEAVELYYEVYGLREGDTYHTTIEVIPLNPRVDRRVSIGSNDQANGPLTSVRKAIGLNRLTDGVYRVIVTVEHEGFRAVKEQEILVLQ
jgi:hypothetical protein